MDEPVQKCLAMRVFILIGWHQTEIDRQLIIHIAEYLQRVAESGLPGDLLLALGIG